MVKPYFIFNDKHLMDLISKMPQTVEQLVSVQGFGRVKCDKYGFDIIRILSKYDDDE